MGDDALRTVTEALSAVRVTVREQMVTQLADGRPADPDGGLLRAELVLEALLDAMQADRVKVEPQLDGSGLWITPA